MTATVIGSLRAHLGLDSSEYHAGVSEAEKATDRLLGGFTRIERGYDKLLASSVSADRAIGDLGAAMQRNVAAFAGIRSAASSAADSASAFLEAFDQADKVDRLRATLDPLYAASSRYEVVVGDVTRAVALGSISQSEANRLMALAEERYLGAARAAQETATATQQSIAAVTGVGREFGSAAESARAFAQAMDAGDEVSRLRASLDPLYAATKRYEAEVEAVRRAVNLGAVSQKDANAVLGLAKQRFDTAASAARAFDAAQDATVNNTGKIGSQVQNISYQLQDFAVQVSAGTSATQALGQQLPQLLGGFGALGAAIGLAAAVVVPLAGSFLTVSEEAETAEDALDEFKGSLSEFDRYSTIAQSSLVDLREEYGRFAYQVRENARDMARTSFEQGIQGLTAAFEPIRAGAREAIEAYQALQEARANFEANTTDAFPETSEQLLQMQETLAIFEDQANSAAAAIGLMPDQVEQLATAFNQVKVAEDLEEGGRRAQELLDLIDQMYPVGVRLPNVLAEMKAHLTEMVGVTSRAQTEAEKLSLTLEGGILAAGGLADAVGVIGGAFAPAISAASTLAAMLDAIMGRISAAASALSRLGTMGAVAGQAISAVQSVGGFLSNLAGGAGDAAARGLDTATDNLRDLWDEAKTGTTTIDELRASLADTFDTGRSGGGGGAGSVVSGAQAIKASLQGILEGLTPAQRGALAFQDVLVEAGYTAEDLGKAKAQTLVRGIDGISNAFGEFISGGLRDFKGFVSSTLDSFKGMLAQMIATAAKNRIMLSMGFGTAGTGAMAGGIGQAIPGAAAGGPMAGIGAALGTIEGGLWSGASSVVGGLFSGGLAGAGSALSSAIGGATAGLGGLATAIGAVAVPVAAAVAVFSAFRKKTEVVDKGLYAFMKNMDALVWTFEETKTSRLFGLIKGGGTDYDRADDETARPIQKAYSQVYQSIAAMADQLGVGAKAFRGFTTDFQVSLKGLTEEQAQEAIAKEFARISDQLAKTAGVSRRFVREGETATQALSRMTTNLAAANGAFKAFGFAAFDASIKGADAASRFVESFGSVEAFAQATDAYFQNFYSLPERVKAASRQFADAIRDTGLTTIPQTIGQFRRMVDAAMSKGQTGRAADLIALADDFKALLDLRQELADAGKGGGTPAEPVDRSRLDGLYRQLFELQGRTQRLREMDLKGMSKAERAIQKRIWALQDEQAATEKAAAAAKARADERKGLQAELWNLTGNTAALRKAELAALDPANRALQKRIWALEDAKTAEEKAAAAADRAKAKAKEIADEREGLMERYYQATGNTAALQAMELKGYNKKNRALARYVMGLEAAREALEALDPQDFANRLAFDRAASRAANTTGAPTGATGAPLAAVPTAPTIKDDAEVRELRRAVQRLEERLIGVMVKVEDHTARAYQTLRKLDREGISERVA
ncbi:hypothetical protein [Rubellimicrobium arenae]|uniref:hypothetical protein n=1 Tax=Rubellimicrobium arenae TaxID=2817372 RepID=UPI001B309625|nr:hypothetical protein [Rubellimicrobium arenae]